MQKLANDIGESFQAVTGDEVVDKLEYMLANDKPLPDLINTMIAPEYAEKVRKFLKRGSPDGQLAELKATERKMQEITNKKPVEAAYRPSPPVKSGESGIVEPGSTTPQLDAFLRANPPPKKPTT